MTDHKLIYNQQARDYQRLVGREDYQNHIVPALQELFPFAGQEIIETGAGTGRLTCLLAPLVKKTWAFDISPHMLQVAGERLSNGGLCNWSLGVCDHRHLPVRSAAAACVISGWSICYVVVNCQPDQKWQDELDMALAEMRRVVRPGGMIIILETQGTGFTSPNPPTKLLAYYAYLKEQGFLSTWIRTDYRFETLQEAQELAAFFFGEAMLEKIVVQDGAVTLPECTGIWWKRV